jgi:hypothetical protein
MCGNVLRAYAGTAAELFRLQETLHGEPGCYLIAEYSDRIHIFCRIDKVHTMRNCYV